MGASRGRLLRLLLYESLVLALLGGALGVALADGGVALFHALRPAALPRAEGVRLDGDSLAFALALSLGCTLLCGLWPALLAVRRDVTGDLHSGRTTLDPRRRRASAALVVSQVAVSLVLLVGGSLLATSFTRLTAVQPGFASEGALTFSVSLPGTRYQRPLGTDRFLRRLEDAIRTLPGVRGVGSVWPLPLSGLNGGGSVEALGTPLVAGRSFASEDPRQAEIARLDAQGPMAEVRTLGESVEDDVAAQRSGRCGRTEPPPRRGRRGRIGRPVLTSSSRFAVRRRRSTAPFPSA